MLFEQCDLSENINDGQEGAVFKSILQDISTGIIILDVEKGIIRFLNPYAANTLTETHTPHDFKSVYSLLRSGLEKLESPDSMDKDNFREVIRYDSKIYGYSGYRLSENKNYIVVLIKDITEQEHLATIAETVELTNNIGYIFSGVRHEIGNILNTLRMTLTVLEKNLDTFPPDKIETYCQRMYEGFDSIQEFLKTFKNFNLYEQPEIKALDLNFFLQRFVNLVRDNAKDKGIEVILDSNDTMNVRIDPRALQQIMLIIFTNAVDAMQGAKQPLFTIHVEQFKAYAILEMTDNGCGMTETQLLNLFRPFYTNKVNGTGLGLVIAKTTLARMDCSIDIQSKYHHGTTVKIMLPYAF